jgi:Flp pilus assembly protein TadG
MGGRIAPLAFINRFRRRTGGATAVELAIVALPFFTLLFAILELAMVFIGRTVLDNSLINTARQIRTGQAQTASMTQAQFRQAICEGIAPLLSCDERLVIDVRRFNSFGGAVTPPPLDQDGNFTGGDAFEPGAAGDIIIARAFYAWPLMSPTSFVFANMNGDAHMLSTATAFRNEPF